MRNSSLVKVLILTIFYAVKLSRFSVNQVSTLLERKFRNYYQHRIVLVGASGVLITYSWLHVERIYV